MFQSTVNKHTEILVKHDMKCSLILSVHKHLLGTGNVSGNIATVYTQIRKGGPHLKGIDSLKRQICK